MAAEMMVSTPWLDAKAAAAYLGRRSANSYRWILRLARLGQIRAGFDGRTYRFRSEDLDAWLYVNAKEAR